MTSPSRTTGAAGPLTTRVFAFLQTMERLVSGAKGAVEGEYWAPLTEFVAVNDFRRLVPENAFPGSDPGTDPWARTVMDWPQYLECFNLWVLAAPRYSNVVKRIAEFPGLVYLEIEEHHGDSIFDSLSVYEFDEQGRIRGIRVAGAADSLTIPPTES
jgi:hypothetical protein